MRHNENFDGFQRSVSRDDSARPLLCLRVFVVSPSACKQTLPSSSISPGRLWWLLRRDLRRGWRASRHHYKTLPRIREWQRPFWTEHRQAIPVHVLTGKNDWQLAAWMLASWFHFSERAWPVVIHDDGTLPKEAA